MADSALRDEEKIFKSENFANKSLEGRDFNSCSFISCDFSGSILNFAKFFDCVFTNCNISLPRLDGCRFQDVQFINCKIVGAEFFKCQKCFFSASFKKCSVQYCNFSDLNMKNTLFQENKIFESHFTNTVLQSADFTDSDLLGTIFHNCDLSKCDFSNATRYAIDPRTNKIKNAKFSLPEAVGLLHGFEIIIV